jgi:hypothetical protein
MIAMVQALCHFGSLLHKFHDKSILLYLIFYYQNDLLLKSIVKIEWVIWVLKLNISQDVDPGCKLCLYCSSYLLKAEGGGSRGI